MTEETRWQRESKLSSLDGRLYTRLIDPEGNQIALHDTDDIDDLADYLNAQESRIRELEEHQAVDHAHLAGWQAAAEAAEAQVSKLEAALEEAREIIGSARPLLAHALGCAAQRAGYCDCNTADWLEIARQALTQQEQP